MSIYTFVFLETAEERCHESVFLRLHCPTRILAVVSRKPFRVSVCQSADHRLLGRATTATRHSHYGY